MASARELASTVASGIGEVIRPGEGALPGSALARVGRIAITFVIVTTNLIGAGAVLVIALFVVPMPDVAHSAHVRLVNGVAAAIYVAVAVPAGVVIGTWRMLRLRQWLAEDRPPSLAETRIVLLAPLRLFTVQVLLWLGAAVLFGVLNLQYSTKLAERTAILIVLTGLVTGSCAYLLTELLLRPAAARALAHGAPGRLVVPGVGTRAVLAWAFGTGVPMLGIVGIGLLALTGDTSASRHQLGVAMVALGGVGIGVGLLAVTVAARATADPVDSVRRALGRVRQGEFDVRVPVYDGTQIGQLQLGFNDMVGGLAERERIRQAFGAYVDPEVAERVLEEGTDLAGEQVEVTVMFIDVEDFTGFAERTPASEVVSTINGLFELIVPIIHEHGGRVDKFVGDGLLAVFGAPRRQADHADEALKAAIEIEKKLEQDAPLDVGIGLNSGEVVAGNIGGAGRVEFSVIGDAVNVAARVEAATRDTGDKILLAERTKELLSDSQFDLQEREGIELKGKSGRVRLYTAG